MTDTSRIQFGIPALDDLLGGGLRPGTLTVVLGATGIGKTQLGLQFARNGLSQEGETGILFDMTSRGDAQNHAEYAQRMSDWSLNEAEFNNHFSPEELWSAEMARKDYLHIFQRAGRRVTISDLEPDDWKEWKAELAKKLQVAIRFFYGNFAHGVRRCVIDGVEPTDKASDSFQFHLFEYIYHQILRKEDEWVARDLFRADFRLQQSQVEKHRYAHEDVGCLLLLTTHEILLDDLMTRRIESGDVLSNANTIIHMGKVKENGGMTRALHVAKHRGSACSEAIVPFEITDSGIVIGK